jgi:hypothetical protein
MRGLPGFLGGGLALIALQTVVANEGAAERFGGLFDLAGELARRIVDPSVPAFGAAPLSDRAARPSSNSNPNEHQGLAPSGSRPIVNDTPAPARNADRFYPSPSSVPIPSAG